MHILVVGAGSIGQVYAHHLRRGGAEVSFLVKPRHAEEARRGFELVQLRGRAPVRLDGIQVFTAARGLPRVDAVFLCVPGPALTPSWIDELAAATGDAPLVFFQA